MQTMITQFSQCIQVTTRRAGLLLVLGGALLLACSTRQTADSRDSSPALTKRDGIVETAARSGGLPANRQFIRNAHLRLDLPDEETIAATFPKGRDLAGRYDGYIQAESARGMTIKIPNPVFERALNDIEGWGEIGDRNIRVSDVTARHVDLSLRIDNARRMQSRLNTMLGEARNIDETLRLEQELQRVTLSLEKMQAEREVLNKDIAFSTIHLTMALKETETRSGPVLLILEYTYKAVRWFFVWDV
ncbi:MAG: DUF4349 domain-containing protein [Leptospirales bacterium]